jgi:hypothetical protein
MRGCIEDTLKQAISVLLQSGFLLAVCLGMSDFIKWYMIPLTATKKIKMVNSF